VAHASIAAERWLAAVRLTASEPPVQHHECTCDVGPAVAPGAMIDTKAKRSSGVLVQMY
jgi:hypothetical protein